MGRRRHLIEVAAARAALLSDQYHRLAETALKEAGIFYGDTSLHGFRCHSLIKGYTGNRALSLSRR